MLHKTVPFYKYHGSGNDFIILDETQTEIVSERLKGKLATLLGDRNTGIGSDGVIFISKFEDIHPRMRFFNPDGSEAEMSGNGIRCSSRFCFDRPFKNQPSLLFETKAGRIKTENFISEKYGLLFVKVFIENATLNPTGILVGNVGTPFVQEEITVLDEKMLATVISIGNPHCVITVKSLKGLDFNTLGPALENHPMFVNRSNISFVEVIDSDKIRVQTHERGVGLTVSCGTGMTASTLSQVLQGTLKSGHPIEVHNAGGIVWVTPHVQGQKIAAQLTGNATFMVEGEVRFKVGEDFVSLAEENPILTGKMDVSENSAFEKLKNSSLFDQEVLKGTSLY